MLRFGNNAPPVLSHGRLGGSMKKPGTRRQKAAVVRAHCLGHFRVEVDSRELDGAQQAQRKPPALLKTLIALGGRDVPEDQITESLCPDADGDAANRAFRTIVYRLRQALGADALRQRRLSLGPGLSCDALDLVPLSAQAESAIDSGNSGEFRHSIDKALVLYRAPFLEGEFDPPEILVARDRLHGRFLRVVREGAGLLERQGDRQGAIRLNL